MNYKPLNYTWCEECLGCAAMESDKLFIPVYKAKDKPKCFEECYTPEEKIQRLRERKEKDVYGSKYGNNT